MTVIYGKVQNNQIVFSNIKESTEFLSSLEGKYISMNINKTTFQRTDSQNNSIHLYFELLSKALNNAGWTVHKLLKHTVEINWTSSLIKELLWRPVQIALTNKNSTTKLDKTSEIDTIYEHINRYISEICHIHVPFPHKEEETPIK